MTTRGLSVIVPTLNCAKEISAHIKSMQAWLDIVDEIIAVDSDSEDDTPKIVRETIRHPGLRQLNHPRGLYQSWNHAISQTTGKWIYISTIGDTITREQLLHLLEVGESLAADVVVSQPKFVFDDHINFEPPLWPVQYILDFHAISGAACIDPVVALIHAARSIPNAIIGSSASNLYRGSHLRQRPFPIKFMMAGDSAWALRYALETRFCYTSRIGSIFRFHSDTYTCYEPEKTMRVASSMYVEFGEIIDRISPIPHAELLAIMQTNMTMNFEFLQARARWGMARRESVIPWYFRPDAICSLMRRNKLRAEIRAMNRKINFEDLIRGVPFLAQMCISSEPDLKTSPISQLLPEQLV